MTKDFQKVMEEVSEQNLESFFQQWIFTKGYPEIKWSWKYKKEKITLKLEQTQDHHLFDFPLEVEIVKDGKTTIKKIQVNDAKSNFEIKVESRPDSVNFDPNLWLLYEEK